MTTETRKNTGTDRKAWKAPQVRAVIPSRRTAGGPFNLNDQDDTFYSTS
jgi:hypothetical protein